jgi:hypothetical protein
MICFIHLPNYNMHNFPRVGKGGGGIVIYVKCTHMCVRILMLLFCPLPLSVHALV